VYAAYNYWAGDQKQITVWPFNQHNGGETFQTREKLRFVRALGARETALSGAR